MHLNRDIRLIAEKMSALLAGSGTVYVVEFKQTPWLFTVALLV